MAEGSPFRWYPLGAYQGLSWGPSWGRETRASQSFAIDGTKQRLRDPQLGSPFTFQVAPPSMLLNALLGGNGADTRDVFDPLLRETFENALGALEATLRNPNATPEEIAAAQQNLVGTRAPPNNSQNVDIIETAMRTRNNFSASKALRANFRRSNFFPDGATRGAALTRAETMVAANGLRFTSNDASKTTANQTAVSDLAQALDVLVQINRMLDTPPLTLLVNPETLVIQYAKKQNYSDRNRFGNVFQSWGEEQVRLSVSGKSAGFVVGGGGFKTTTGADRKTSGYQFASKWDSAAWQNLMGLFTLYRNNAYFHDIAGSEAHVFVGNIHILYDQWAYLGQFDSFQYEYVETRQQGAVDFSFDFTASFIFDSAQSGPVRPMIGPTPSPSAATRGGTPFMPNPQAKTARALSSPSISNPSTAILDPLVDPFDPALQQRASSRGRAGTVNLFQNRR